MLIVEKEPRFGGTTARSGGWLWIPGTSLARAWGIVESPDQARTYLRHEAGNSFDAARVDAFLTAGPEAVDFFTSKTAVQVRHAADVSGLPRRGARRRAGRPLDGDAAVRRSRAWSAHQGSRRPLPELTVFGMMLGSGKEIIHFMRATKSLTSALYVAKRLSKHLMDVMRHGRGMTLTNGNALAGRLAKSAFDLKIPLWLSSPVRELIVEDGAVRGAHGGARRTAGARQCEARRGPRLRRLSARRRPAQGNVSARADRQRAFLARPDRQHRRRLAAGGIGRRSRRGLAAECRGLGAGLDHDAQGRQQGRDAAFHRPRQARRDRGDARRRALCQRRQFLPRLRAGHGEGRQARRGDRGLPDLRSSALAQIRPRLRAAVSDAASAITCAPAISCAARRSPNSRHGPASMRRDCRPRSRNSTRRRASGQDPAFGKGSRAYNRYQGDALHGPNPCIAPIEHGPFYAIKMVIGDLGTYAGIRTDAHARALDADGHPIAGLYAAGNDMASIMGGNYPGAGITLGPALTFGYIAGKHIAGETWR